ncbi:MAG: MarR family transcriptional regulator [Elusimicrobiota bacterium]|nr:MAG: MarR family transcriptional regulator [Elusimicrobiota bacterium]
MSLEDRARKLVGHLQTVMEEAEAVDKKDSAVREKLTWQERRVLRAVSREDCCSMSTLADKICLTLSSVTGLIDRLVDRKLVKRDRSSEDRRVVQVELTEHGRALNEEAMEGPTRFSRELLKGLNAEEQESLLALFRKISERIESEKKAA